MRAVSAPLYDHMHDGITVGYREKSAEVAVLFDVNGSDVVEWYDWSELTFLV